MTVEGLTEAVRDLAVYVERLAKHMGDDRTASLVCELIEALDPDPGYAPGHEPFGAPV